MSKYLNKVIILTSIRHELPNSGSFGPWNPQVHPPHSLEPNVHLIYHYGGLVSLVSFTVERPPYYCWGRLRFLGCHFDHSSGYYLAFSGGVT